MLCFYLTKMLKKCKPSTMSKGPKGTNVGVTQALTSKGDHTNTDI